MKPSHHQNFGSENLAAVRADDGILDPGFCSGFLRSRFLQSRFFPDQVFPIVFQINGIEIIWWTRLTVGIRLFVACRTKRSGKCCDGSSSQLPISRQMPRQECSNRNLRLSTLIVRCGILWRVKCYPCKIQPLAKAVSRRAGSSTKMLSCCANPQCGKPFLRLREGKLFLVETERVSKGGGAVSSAVNRGRKQQRGIEHFWLCDVCAAHWTLTYEQDEGVSLIPLRRAVRSAGAAVGDRSVGDRSLGDRCADDHYVGDRCPEAA